jgi:hypothetical protein
MRLLRADGARNGFFIRDRRAPGGGRSFVLCGRRDRPLLAKRVKFCGIALAGRLLERLHGRMEELVDEAAGERLDGCKLLRGKYSETAVKTLDFGNANLFGFPL